MAAVNCWMSCVKSLALTNKLLRSVVESLSFRFEELEI